MQDRFKFRVWDKINEIWVKNFSIDEQGFVECFYNPTQAMNRRLVLMQCTGLKDKNGKLIYEGDIVERKNGFSIKRGVVYFNEVFTQFAATNMSHYSLVNRSIVIGNIYQNKELLED